VVDRDGRSAIALAAGQAGCTVDTRRPVGCSPSTPCSMAEAFTDGTGRMEQLVDAAAPMRIHRVDGAP